jgi:membrane protease YdiL (CAAX protease family)
VLVVGLIGLPTGIIQFPSFPASAASIGWKVATIAVMATSVQLFEGRSLSIRDAGLLPLGSSPIASRGRIALPVSIVLVALTFAWGSIPGLRQLSSSGSGSSYDAGKVTTALLVFKLLVRYPIGVLAEEAFFRGFLQPRTPVAAPVVTGIFFALYHLQQWRTIPSLIPYGIALGLLRWWLGSIWPGAALHYTGNALFILSLYRRS